MNQISDARTDETDDFSPSICSLTLEKTLTVTFTAAPLKEGAELTVERALEVQIGLHALVCLGGKPLVHVPVVDSFLLAITIYNMAIFSEISSDIKSSSDFSSVTVAEWPVVAVPQPHKNCK